MIFRSYRDGARVTLTPESSVAAQKARRAPPACRRLTRKLANYNHTSYASQAFGADIILPLDELTPFHITPAKLAASTARSHRWMARSLAAHLAAPGAQAMYGIIHGGTDAELRAGSAAYLCSLPFGAWMRARIAGIYRAAVSWTRALTLLLRLVQMALPLAAHWGATARR